MEKRFELHPQLAKDCLAAGDFPLCRLLLMNDAQYPWFILVPRRADVREIHELNDADRHQLWEESAALSRLLMSEFSGDKLNVAALGNVVPQLHVHHIVRFKTDPAWPAPVWGKFLPRPYSLSGATALVDRLQRALSSAATPLSPV